MPRFEVLVVRKKKKKKEKKTHTHTHTLEKSVLVHVLRFTQ